MTRPTDSEIDAAWQTLRADYYHDVRDIALDVVQRVKDGELKDAEAVGVALDESVDGSQWVIYTAQNFTVLACSDNRDAYQDDYGDELPRDNTWAVLAYAAMRRDCEERLAAEGDLFPESDD